jgi:hypothetical protein
VKEPQSFNVSQEIQEPKALHAWGKGGFCFWGKEKLFLGKKKKKKKKKKNEDRRA